MVLEWEMEEVKPNWLDEGFVTHVLKSVEDVGEDKLSLSGWQCSLAVPPGTNYLSVLYRLRVDYQIENDSRSVSLIIKIPLESGQVRDFVDKVDGYNRELKMYREVLVSMYQIDNSTIISARSYDCPLHQSLVLEDLRELGYKMADRLKQLDAAHCRQFLKSLATFHGLSVALLKKDPQLVMSVEKNMFFDENESEEDKTHNENYTKFNLGAMSKTVESLGFKRYAEIIRGKIDSFYTTITKIFKPSGELRVLSHGDCWTANVLFNYDEFNAVADAKLVDFQMIRIGSYVQDVLQFWWTSARQDVREHLQDEMFETYRKALNQTLENVQMPERVSKEEFDREIRRFSPYALQVCSCLLPVVLADPDDLVDFNELSREEFEKVGGDAIATKNFRGKYYKALLPDLLRQLERFGAL